MLDSIANAHQQHCQPKLKAKPIAAAVSRTVAPTLPAGSYPFDIDRIRSAAPYINPDCDDDTWKFTVMAVLARKALEQPDHAEALKQVAHDISSGALRETPAVKWTKLSPSNGLTGEDSFEATWQRFLREESPEIVRTLGSFIQLAREGGWSDPGRFQAVEGSTEKLPLAEAALFFLQGQFALIVLDGRLWLLDLRSLNQVTQQGVAKPLSLSNRKDGTLLMLRALHRHLGADVPNSVLGAFFTSPDSICFEGVEYNPKETSPGYLNLWQGPALEPRKGNWALIDELLFEVICSRDIPAYRYLIMFLAHTLQRPWDKPGVMIILIGGQGVGKGTLARLLHRIWGPAFLQVHDIHAVTGNFNAALERSLIVFMDEALFVGDRRSSDALKSLVTEPLVYINQKHQPARQMQSCHRFFAATNAEHFKHTERDDRRDFVLKVSEHRKGDHAFWKAVHGEIESDGAKAFMQHLLDLDLSAFNVRDKPQTQALMQQKLMSLDPIALWWYEQLMELGDMGWGRFIPTQHMLNKINEAMFDRLYRKARANDLMAAVAKMCPSAKKHQQTEHHSRIRGLLVPEVEIARAEFEAWIGGEISWQEDAE
ncbi:MAG: hypothetical protein HQL47_08960 [Gammaproteobacteria bacterium]|nr:hypothetical protein [Gammaproteobacteria bacterium]